jgi:hypothetical protein
LKEVILNPHLIEAQLYSGFDSNMTINIGRSKMSRIVSLYQPLDDLISELLYRKNEGNKVVELKQVAITFKEMGTLILLIPTIKVKNGYFNISMSNLSCLSD